jgi:sulfur carrier protein
MEVKVFNEKEQTTEQVNFAGNLVKELLQHLKINPETVLVIKNNEVVTEDEPLQQSDSLELLSVISGG